MASVNNHETQINNINNTRHRIKAKIINSGTDLNNIYESGFYVSKLDSNQIVNAPPFSTAFELTVTGLDTETVSYTTQLAKDYNSNQYYVRTQTHWEPSQANWTPWKKFWIQDDAITNAVWNDYAERFEKPVELKTEPGDIIALDKSTETEMYKLAEEGDSNIVGVHSDEYGMLIGGVADDEEYNKEHFIPVGMIGRVKTKVIGPIHKGDRIVPSNIPGVGRVFENGDNMFAIVGFATETNLDLNIKKVRTKINTY